MKNFLTQIIGDKQEWWRMEARAKALPSDYQILCREIQPYMWKFTSGNGMDIVAILKDVLELFETGAVDGKRALDITGDDVAGFCDGLLRNANTYTENWREELNRNVKQKLQIGETRR